MGSAKADNRNPFTAEHGKDNDHSSVEEITNRLHTAATMAIHLCRLDYRMALIKKTDIGKIEAVLAILARRSVHPM